MDAEMIDEMLNELDAGTANGRAAPPTAPQGPPRPAPRPPVAPVWPPEDVSIDKDVFARKTECARRKYQAKRPRTDEYLRVCRVQLKTDRERRFGFCNPCYETVRKQAHPLAKKLAETKKTLKETLCEVNLDIRVKEQAAKSQTTFAGNMLYTKSREQKVNSILTAIENSAEYAEAVKYKDELLSRQPLQ